MLARCWIAVVCGGAVAFGSPLRETANGKWTEVKSLPANRAGTQSGTLPDGSVLCVGGQGKEFRTTEQYQPENDTWTRGPNMNFDHASFGLAVLEDGRLLVGGGWQFDPTPKHYSDKVEIFDPKTNVWTPLAPMNIGREDFPLVPLIGNKAVAVGGGVATGSSEASVELYDVETDEWTNMADAPTARRCQGGAMLLDGRVIVAGGARGYDPISVVEIYTPSTDSWETAASMKTPRFSFGLVTLPSGKVVAGPGRIAEFDATDAVELYDPTTDVWEKLKHSPVSRSGYGMSLLPGGDGQPQLLFSGGYQPGRLGSKGCYKLTLPEATSYRCLNETCVAVPLKEGVSKAKCDEACGPNAKEFGCVAGRCVAQDGGIPKTTCEKVCRPAEAGLFGPE